MSGSSPQSGLFHSIERQPREEQDERASPLQPALSSPDAAPRDTESPALHVPPGPDIDRLAAGGESGEKMDAPHSIRDVPVYIASPREDSDALANTQPDDGGAVSSEAVSESPVTEGEAASQSSQAARVEVASAASEQQTAKAGEVDEPKLTWAERARRGLLTPTVAAESQNSASPPSAPRPMVDTKQAARRDTPAGETEAQPRAMNQPKQHRPADAPAQPETWRALYPSVPAASVEATSPESPSPSPVASDTSPAEPQPGPEQPSSGPAPQPSAPESLAGMTASLQRIERLLGEIRGVMDVESREERYKEFSLPQLIAPVAQLAAVALLLFALLDLIFDGDVPGTLVKLGFACAVQLVALTAMIAATGNRNR